MHSTSWRGMRASLHCCQGYCGLYAPHDRPPPLRLAFQPGLHLRFSHRLGPSRWTAGYVCWFHSRVIIVKVVNRCISFYY
jgi:hypothetical protein